MDEKSNIYQINEFPFIQYLGRFLFTGWICFAAWKFELNPNFFGLTILVAIILIMSIAETSIKVTKAFLIYEQKRWLPFITKTRQFDYNEIASITYEKGKFSELGLLLNLIESVPGTVKKSSLVVIKMKNNSIIELVTVGN